MPSSSSERPNATTWLAVLAIAAFFVFSMAFPVLYMVKKAFLSDGRLSLSFFKLLFSNEIMTESIVNSLLLAVCVTGITAAIGFSLAWLMSRTDMPAKGLWGNLFLAPLILPPFVGAIGVKFVFGRFGMINSLLIQAGLLNPRSPIDWLGAPFWGVVILEVLHLFPIMYLNIMGSFALVDPSIEEAARGLGARGARLFRTIMLPLLAPGFFAGASIVFIWAFTDLGTPLLFEYTSVAPVQIFNSLQATKENLMGYSLVVVVLAMTAVLFAVSKFAFGGRRVDMPAFGRTSGTIARLGIPLKILICLLLAVFVALSIVPHVSVALVSLSKEWFMTVLPEKWTFGYYGKVFTHPMSYVSIKNSIAFSSAAVAVVLIMGVAIAWILARKKFRGQWVLDICAMLPLAVPGVVLAFGYVQGFFGTALDPRINPAPLLVISYSVRRLPLVVRALYAGFQQTGVVLEEAAASLGAPALTVLRTITFPLIRANLLGAAILAFAFSMLEVSDSLILAMEDRFYPITKAIYMLLGRLGDGGMIASAMGILGVVLLAAALVTAQKLLGRRMGDLFRT